MDNKELANQFIQQWQNGITTFSIHTSGSTGVPKTIVLQKEWMEWSAKQTALFIQPQANDKILCCLPINKVGGLMQIVRSLVWQVPLHIEESTANPLLNIKNNNCTIISLTPYQLHYILQNKESISILKSFREVLIGGSDIAENLIQAINTLGFENTIFRHSYGMTETYSHIALRTINGIDKTDWFTPFKAVQITVNKDNCAQIKVPYYSQILQTTDIIQLNAQGQFKIIGRADNIINSGGVKIQPELIEQAIKQHFKIGEIFIVSSKPDTVLGQKLIVLAEPIFNISLQQLAFLKEINNYAVPKEIVYINKLPRNEGGKVMRNV